MMLSLCANLFLLFIAIFLICSGALLVVFSIYWIYNILERIKK